MSRWTAESDMDYADEVAGQSAPFEFLVTCVACAGEFYVRADERPPYRCDDCLERAEVRQREVA